MITSMVDYLKDISTNLFLYNDTSEKAELYTLLEQLPLLPLIHFKKNQRIYTTGQTVKGLYLLKSGLVRIYDQSDSLKYNNNDINLRFLCDDSIVMPFYAISTQWQIGSGNLNHTKSTETAEAVTYCSGYLIPFATLNTLGNWQYQLKLEITIRHYRSMEDRLRMLQLQSAYQRYENFITFAPQKIVSGMPSKHIASYLGISPETLSRIKRQYDDNN